MLAHYACGSPEHLPSRRGFLGGLAAGALGAGLGTLARPAVAADLARAQKRVLLVWLNGAVSQLETWDPKPGTDTGGPFRAIATSAPGVHVCELLPHTAKQMHRLALVRGVNTAEDDHGKGAVIMQTGRRPEPRSEYPHLGSVMAKLLGDEDSPLPGYVHVTPRAGGGSGKDSAFLGPKYASVALPDGRPPDNLLRPDALGEAADRARNDLRRRADDRFLARRRTAETEAYTQTFEQAARVMQKRGVFDLAKESAALRDRYGAHDFGRHCLLARRLLEAGVTFVKLTHTNYDTHHENFDFHIEQVGEFDRSFATLIDDLHQRGLLATTLVIVAAEFGRTPKINRNYGRDHWSRAWSVALGGCGIKGGAVAGKTNANGTAVTDREVNAGHLFHTYFRALGLNPKRNHYPQGQPIPMADPKADAITEVLA
ncbi:MAG TPA: DUF1501 domain-containing protein [Gemmataceae bacterium]|nr:DUF1501 domain-containing protein [Gemmataceae bacterium]